MAVSAVLAPAVTQTSSLGIFTLFNLSFERIPKQTDHATPPPPSSSTTASPSTSQNHQSSPSHGQSSLSSSPRFYPTDLSHPILEEGDESESDAPNEPVTPVSGRQSQDFHTLQSHEIHHHDSNSQSIASESGNTAPFSSIRPETAPALKAPIIVNTAATPPPPKTPNTANTSAVFAPPTTPATPGGASDPQSPPLSRRSTRGSSTSVVKPLRRAVSSFFRRNSQSDKMAFGFTEPGYNAASDSNLAEGQRKNAARPVIQKSSTTTQSNTPPSPGSPPLELSLRQKSHIETATVPSQDDFLMNHKKNRASTGLSIHRAINFVTSNNRNADAKKMRPTRRRASSFDFSKQQEPYDKGQPWALPAESGTGLKSRRMSVNLPDDFTVDIADLHDEFEYLHKMGRHRKHLGKGATSKVTLMYRKGCQDELYAVKEFRGKSSSETKEEYEKKVKSEYSIAKSLHHPNIVETIRLCTDHGRWNHVMEYCQEGDLFSLVEKKYLNKADREKDRHCLFKQLVQGLNYLHTNGIAHRDVKLENLLITNNSKLKITDFGVSEVFSGTHPGLREAAGQCGQNVDGEVRLCSQGICGSMPYISPEVIAAKDQYDPRKLDVWGAAVVFLTLIFGAPLWNKAEDSETQTQYKALVKGWDKWRAKHNEDDEFTDTDYPKMQAFDFAINPPIIRRILLHMLDPNPKTRWTMSQVLNSRWVKGIECCQLDSYDDPAKLIDASKKNCTKINGFKIYCHDHLPPRSHGGHSLGKMPGSVGY